MTPRQQRFVDEYLVDLNGTQAAIRAGYSARTANEQAVRLLADVSVAAAVAEGKRARANRVEISQDEILRRLLDIATVDVNELVEYRREPCLQCWKPTTDEALRDANAEGEAERRPDPDPECQACHGDGIGHPVFKDSRKLSPAARALYAGVKVTKDGCEMLTVSRDKALALLAAHVGIGGKRLELTGKDGAPLPSTTVIGGVTPEQLAQAVREALGKV